MNTEILLTRLSPELKHKAQQLANADRRSVSAWVRNMIESEWEALRERALLTNLPPHDIR